MYDELTRDRVKTLAGEGLNTVHPQILVSRLNSILIDSAWRAPGKCEKYKKRNSKRQWATHLEPYIRACKHAHVKWKNYKNVNNCAKHNAAKKLLRSAQRQLAARKRVDEHQRIMEAQGFNGQYFYKLIRKQRKTPKVNNMWNLKTQTLSSLKDGQIMLKSQPPPPITHHTMIRIRTQLRCKSC